jgi:NAD(P)-dependent dehydrogenase (short-subunit alcohol dehydrogenase family)
MDLGLAGLKAVVSGGTRGIGRAIVETLLAEGASVAFCARKGSEVAEAEAALKAGGKTVFADAVDVRDGDNYKAWINQCAERMGGIDVFVPNVSAGGGMGGEEKWRDSFEIDLLGAVRGAETAMPHLEKSGKGAIVFISTTAATEAFVGPQAYNAIKAAINNYAKNLANAAAPKGVRVNAVSPGPVYFEGGSWSMIEKHMKPFFDMTMKQIPMGRMASPLDVARAVAYLASPAASYITGTNLVVDGGMTRRVDY